MLQGSLDNFALDEVLGLLSSTAKTGQLDLKGDRGVGALMLHQGRLVDASASNTANGTAPEDILFELLRFENGTFNFAVRDVDGSQSPSDIGDVLASAEARLADWRTIEAVIPSLTHLVSPARSLPADEMTVSSVEWSTIVVIGAGCQVSRVCDELTLGEVEGSRQIKGLVERGLVNIGPPATGTASVSTGRSTTDERPETTSKDPFARRAEMSSPSALSRFSSPADGSEKSDAESGVGAGSSSAIGGAAQTVSAFSPPTTERPPMPPAPTIEELTGATVSSPSTPPPIVGNGTGNGSQGDAAETAKDDGKGGGLLMRYLKNDD